MSPGPARVACIIPAKDEQDRIAATVTAARGLPGVETVVVCDDGSSDATAQHAGAAGAVVVSHERNRGKAAAVESAVNGLGVLEQRDRRPEADVLLLLDADLGATASRCAPLVEAVVSGRAALAIAGLPPHPPPPGPPAGGLGLGTGPPRRGFEELTGWSPRAPLSGQRCLTRRAFELASPLAPGWGMEVGMSVDVLRAGLVVEEIDVDLTHRATGSDLASQLHRASQLKDVTRALAARGLVRNQLRDLSADGVSGLLKPIGRGAR